jgi:hypothetical protein
MIIMGLVKICLFQPFTYTELGRLQTENIKLKNNIEQLSIEEQLISTDNKVRFYADSIVTICSTICNLQPKLDCHGYISSLIYVLIFKSRQINNFTILFHNNMEI